MTDPNEAAEPTDMLLHDLRRFLHNAHDQQDALAKIANVMANATGHMKVHEAATKRVLQSLRRQVDAGVTVHIDTDLNAHVTRVSQVTSPLVKGIGQLTDTVRRCSIMIAAIAFGAGLAGSLLGVFVALRLL